VGFAPDNEFQNGLSEELSMQTVTTIGLGIAKSVFQVRAKGDVIIRRQLKRRYVLAGRRGSKKTV
jgi:lipid-binding SYLF domain-containing protein